MALTLRDFLSVSAGPFDEPPSPSFRLTSASTGVWPATLDRTAPISTWISELDAFIALLTARSMRLVFLPPLMLRFSSCSCRRPSSDSVSLLTSELSKASSKSLAPSGWGSSSSLDILRLRKGRVRWWA
jgi:hypothetical protein